MLLAYTLMTTSVAAVYDELSMIASGPSKYMYDAELSDPPCMLSAHVNWNDCTFKSMPFNGIPTVPVGHVGDEALFLISTVP